MTTVGTSQGLTIEPPRQPLARRIAIRVAVRITLVVVAASLLGYWHVKSGLEEQAVSDLKRYIAERRARENIPFEHAGQSLDFLADRLKQLLASRTAPSLFRFSLLFERQPPGEWRTRQPLFERDDITGFVGRHVDLDETTRDVLVAAVGLLADLGPTVRGRFANLYVLTPQNAVVMYWPGEPWALDHADWEIYGKLQLAAAGATGNGVVVLDETPDAAADEAVRWSGLYFDYGVNKWLVSATRPVVVDGRQVATIVHDLLVRDLIERVLLSESDGVYNVLMTESGELIAHPHYMDAIEASGGTLNVADTGSRELQSLFRAAGSSVASGDIVSDAGSGVFVAATRLAGPGWYILTVVPRAVVTERARAIALLILAVGLFALIVELLILSAALRRGFGAPLAELTEAAAKAAKARYRDVKLDTSRNDELGVLARSFMQMVHEIDARRTALSNRNKELAELADQLRHELAERERAERELARHRELNALLDTIDYGVLFLDADLNIQLANEAYRRMWTSAIDPSKRPARIDDAIDESRRLGLYLVPDGAYEAYKKRRIAEIRAGDAGPNELPLASGTVLEYKVIALPGGGRMLTYFDLTRRKKAEEELRRYLVGMEASMDGVALLDRQGRFLFVNAAHAEIYGFASREALVGRPWHDVYEPEERERIEREVFPPLVATGQWRGEAVGRKADGQHFPQEISLALTPDGGIVAIVRDITQRREREKALDRAVHQAEEANAAKSRFLASISHELRTPMNAIIGFTRIVRRTISDDIPPRQAENLDKILVSAEHLLELINDVLDISKIEAGRVEVLNRPFLPDTIVDECLRTVEPIVASGVALRREGPRLGRNAVGDSSKIRQILLNLLSNAAKFTSRGEITLGVEIVGDDLVFRVRDTGIGIPPEALGKIFHEFGQHHEPSSGQPRGTGLGLTISRRLARLLGGDIDLWSEVGVGSVFTLRVPWREDVESEPAAPLARTA